MTQQHDQSVSDESDVSDIQYVSTPNRITIGIHVDKHAELPSAAASISQFINALRDGTDELFEMDVQAVVNAPKPYEVRPVEAIGFAPGVHDDYGDIEERRSSDVRAF